MEMKVKLRHGYGYSLLEADIYPDDLDSLLRLIDMAPKYAESLSDIRAEIDPESPYARTELLEYLNPDYPLKALADILVNVIAETENVQMVAAVDFSDSDNIILAYPESMEQLGLFTRKKVDSICKRYISVLQKLYPWPSWVTWMEEIPTPRQFLVETPLGKLKVWAKHGDTDSAEDYPGVYIDWIDPKSGTQTMLAVVEYDPSDNRLQTCTYDAGQEEPTSIMHHEIGNEVPA